jgi:hypothetical protein
MTQDNKATPILDATLSWQTVGAQEAKLYHIVKASTQTYTHFPLTKGNHIAKSEISTAEKYIPVSLRGLFAES